MTIVNELDFSNLPLKVGSHAPNTDQEWCLLEAAAYVAGEPWSDHPQCVSRVIGAFGRSFNDNLDDAGRARLAPFIPKLIGTNTGEADEDRRAWLIADWMTHVHLPTWLDAAGMHDQAQLVRALPRITDDATWVQARTAIQPIRDAAWDRRNAALDPIRQKVREAVANRLTGTPKAAAEAVAASAAVVAAAVAASAEAAVAASASAEAAAAVAAVAPYWRVYDAVKEAVLPIFRKAIAEHTTIGPVAESMQSSGFELLEQLCAIGR